MCTWASLSQSNGAVTLAPAEYVRLCCTFPTVLGRDISSTAGSPVPSRSPVSSLGLRSLECWARVGCGFQHRSPGGQYFCGLLSSRDKAFQLIMAAVAGGVDPTGESVIKHRGKGRGWPVQALSSKVSGVYPSTIRRNLWSKRGLLEKGSYMVAAAVLATAAAQVSEGPGAAPFSEDMSTMEGIGGGSSVLRHAAPRGGRRLRAFQSTEQCINSPLWGKQVDPANYVFGCKEIEVRVYRVWYDSDAFSLSSCRYEASGGCSDART